MKRYLFFTLFLVLSLHLNSWSDSTLMCDSSNPRLRVSCEEWDTLGPLIMVSIILVRPVVDFDLLCGDIVEDPRSQAWTLECDSRYNDTLASYYEERREQVVALLTSYALYDTADSSRRLDSSDYESSGGYLVIAEKNAVLGLAEEPLVLRVTYIRYDTSGMAVGRNVQQQNVRRSSQLHRRAVDLHGRVLGDGEQRKASYAVQLRDGRIVVGGRNR